MMGFKFNNVHSSTYGLRVRTVLPPGIPQARYTLVNVIGKDGSYKFFDSYDDMEIIFDVLIEGSKTERRNKVVLIRSWLAGEKDLVIDYDPTTYKAVLEDSDIRDFKNNSEILTLTFKATVSA
ncbi:MAG: hypothetical protein GX808_04035 [Syntrophomonadaceae bacterium]|jgi:phage-related protein|nr:hypothetical protein [Syntrophomonadaceae bacterium]